MDRKIKNDSLLRIKKENEENALIQTFKPEDLEKTNERNSKFEQYEKELLFESSMITFDEILDKVGFTNYHLIIYLIVCLSLCSDGSQIYLLYLLTPVLKNVYKISDNHTSLITSVLFIGLVLGAMSTGPLISYYGRRKIMLFSMGIVTILGTFFVFLENIIWFSFCRLIIGFFVGILFNLVNSLFEILPSKNRDFLIGSIFFAEKIGIIYYTLIFYVFSIYTNIEKTYKMMFFIINIPIFLCLIISLFYLEESPRLLLHKGYFPEAYEVIQSMLKGSDYRLSKTEFKKLKNHIKDLKEREKNQTNNPESSEISSNEVSHSNNEYSHFSRKTEILLINEDYKEKYLGKDDLDNDSKELLLAKDCVNIAAKKKIKKERVNKISPDNFNIFSQKLWFLTLIVSMLWAFNSLCKYSNMYIMPIILHKKLELDMKNLSSANKTVIDSPFSISNESSSGKNEKSLTNFIEEITKSNYFYFNSYLDVMSEEIVFEKGNDEVFLKKKKEKLNKILISNLLPLPAELLAGILTNLSFFGRKSLIFIGFMLMALSSFWMLLDKENLYISSGMINFSGVISYSIVKLYTCEVYDTQVRDFAYSLGYFSSRFISILVPFICNILLHWGINFSITFICISCLIGAFITLILPFDTFGKKIE